MPKIHTVRRHNIHRVKAAVDGDNDAQITMSYVNQKAPNENFTQGPTGSISKVMLFDEVGLHTLTFVAVGSIEAEGSSLRVTVTDIDQSDKVIVDSGKVAFKEGLANVVVWLSP